jgi:hypothetical protein
MNPLFEKGATMVLKDKKEPKRKLRYALGIDANGVPLKKGDRVKWTEAYTRRLYLRSRQHRAEFMGQVGVVEDLCKWGEERGPEVNVRYFHSNFFGKSKNGLRYSAHPSDLVKVTP